MKTRRVNVKRDSSARFKRCIQRRFLLLSSAPRLRVLARFAQKGDLLAGYVKTSRVQIAQENIKKGPLSTLPRVVPLLTSLHSQTIPLLNTRCLRTDRKFKYQSNICGLNGLLFNFSANRWMVPNVVKGLPKVHCEKSYMYCFSYCGCHLMQQANCVA